MSLQVTAHSTPSWTQGEGAIEYYGLHAAMSPIEQRLSLSPRGHERRLQDNIH